VHLDPLAAVHGHAAVVLAEQVEHAGVHGRHDDGLGGVGLLLDTARVLGGEGQLAAARPDAQRVEQRVVAAPRAGHGGGGGADGGGVDGHGRLLVLGPPDPPSAPDS
jgi:hypothetical protein